MDKHAIKECIYGGVNELIHNNKFYWKSPVGADYCRFTEEGVIALSDFMNQMAVAMFKAEQIELDKRAKELVLKGLKGEKI